MGPESNRSDSKGEDGDKNGGDGGGGGFGGREGAISPAEVTTSYTTSSTTTTTTATTGYSTTLTVGTIASSGRSSPPSTSSAAAPNASGRKVMVLTSKSREEEEVDEVSGCNNGNKSKDGSVEEIPLETFSSHRSPPPLQTSKIEDKDFPSSGLENDGSSSTPSTVVNDTSFGFKKNPKDCDVENICSIKHSLHDDGREDGDGIEHGNVERDDDDNDDVDNDYDYGNYEEEEDDDGDHEDECLKINEEEEDLEPSKIQVIDSGGGNENINERKGRMSLDVKKEVDEDGNDDDEEDVHDHEKYSRNEYVIQNTKETIEKRESNEITVISTTIMDDKHRDGDRHEYVKRSSSKLPSITETRTELVKGGRWRFKKNERKKSCPIVSNNNNNSTSQLTVGRTSIKSQSMDDVKMVTNKDGAGKKAKSKVRIKMFSSSSRSYKWIPGRKQSLIGMAQMEAKISSANPNATLKATGSVNASNVTVSITSTRESLEAKRERKAAKTLAIITGAFVVCWLPFFIIALLMPICESCREIIPDLVFNICLWLGYLNSLINPIIYTIFNLEFRAAFKKMLFGKRFNQNQMRSSRRV